LALLILSTTLLFTPVAKKALVKGAVQDFKIISDFLQRIWLVLPIYFSSLLVI